jgi:hypothetical protein
MKKKIIILLLFSVSINWVTGQKIYPDRLKVFIDCFRGCDKQFIRSEINIVDFLLDRQAADIHILINDQNTGSGGDEYQLIFLGQNRFKRFTDTLYFINDANATDFEERAALIKYIKLGLAPYIARTKMASAIQIDMKDENKGNDDKKNLNTSTKDPWNYWVLRIGTNGYFSADEVYKSSRLSGNVSATRITEKNKTGIEFYGGKNLTTYKLDDGNGNLEKIIIRNSDFNINQYFVKGIDEHWSCGYEAAVSRNTFSNNKGRYFFRTGVEYAIYPYKQVNTRFFTVSYTVDIRRNVYFDTTLYDKLKETLFGQSVNAKISMYQKWGNISFGASYHNYFHNWNFYNFGINTQVEIRITGGLSFNIYSYGELTRDQLFLPKEGATSQEVLTRRRQLASGYNFYTSFGINYRFGSKLNNFVNPRFD